jgi:DinB superfamily
MKKSSLPRNPSYFDTYINQVEDIELSAAFEQSIAAIDALDLDLLYAIGEQVYAPGKWSIKELLLHITDAERVFAYRALRFARNDKTPLPGFDENAFVEYCGANRRSLSDLLAELRCVRESSKMLFASFDDTALARTGIMYNTELPVLAIGFTIIGHQNHHFRVLQERYYPIAQPTA